MVWGGEGWLGGGRVLVWGLVYGGLVVVKVGLWWFGSGLGWLGGGLG